MKNLSATALFIVAWVLIMPSRTHAYLDPGSGSYAIQVVIGLVLTSAYTVKVQWAKIRLFFTRKNTSRTAALKIDKPSEAKSFLKKKTNLKKK